MSPADRHGRLAARAEFRRALARFARRELAALASRPDRRARFDPGRLYPPLVRCLRPLAASGLYRPRLFARERERWRDAATAEVLAAPDALCERLLKFALSHGPEVALPSGLAWPELPEEPRLAEAVAALDPMLGPEEFLPRFDLALKGFFVLHSALFEHDDVWYALYARQLCNAAFLALAMPDLEREVSTLLSRLFLVYPFTWAGERDLACRPLPQRAYFAKRFPQARRGGGACASSSRPTPSPPRTWTEGLRPLDPRGGMPAAAPHRDLGRSPSAPPYSPAHALPAAYLNSPPAW